MAGPHPAVADVRRAVRDSLAGLPDGALVLVGCSGGADSLALAAATAFVVGSVPLRDRALRAGAVVVDHGLQAGSDERSERTAQVLRGLDLAPVDVVAVTVHGPGGPEAAARSARYTALRAAAARHGAVTVLLGHTLDDQAETVLLGLARGSGARSLAGMAPVAGLLRRPLLDLPRSTTRAACAALGLEPWDDPHNADPAYTRSRLRTRALPVLEDELGPGVSAALARTARLLRADADALDRWADHALAEVTVAPGSLDVAGLEALPVAVRGRVLRRAAVLAGCPAGALAADHVAAVDGLVTRWHGQGPLDLPGGVSASRACGRLVLARPVVDPDAGPDGRGP
ncbi:MAG: tRNA lysidine(34) synthetase TilS [Motilibacteraceae bacterium]